MSASPETTDLFGLTGTLLDGQYRVDEVVGEGGFGLVYRGWHVSFDQPIAIKALKLPAVDTDTQNSVLAKFRDEARLLYVLSQSSLDIVRSIGFGAVNTPSGLWAPFVVLEWLEGRSLADDLALRRRASMQGRPLAEALALMEPAARGLSAAHAKHVAHRDVKPANFFLTQTRDQPPRQTMKVLDFGIAKVMMEGDSADVVGSRSTGFTSFTPYYAAPEQLDGKLGATGPWTDVYAFALVLSEVLTDHAPVAGSDMISVVASALDAKTRPTPRNRGAVVPDAVEAVFARALSIDPRARYADAAQFWDALSNAAKQGGTLAIPSRPQPVPRVNTGPGGTKPMPSVPMPAALPVVQPQPIFPQTPVWTPPPGPPTGPAPHPPPYMPHTPVWQRPMAPPPEGGSHWMWILVVGGIVGCALALALLRSCAIAMSQ